MNMISIFLGLMMMLNPSLSTQLFCKSEDSIELIDIEFISDRIGWLYGTSGTLLLTTDSGENWKNISLKTESQFKDMDFIDSQNGWILATFGGTTSDILFRTKSGGENWTTIPLDSIYCPSRIINLYNLCLFSEIDFINSDTGFILFKNRKLLKTVDGGINWFPVNIFK